MDLSNPKAKRQVKTGLFSGIGQPLLYGAVGAVILISFLWIFSSGKVKKEPVQIKIPENITNKYFDSFKTQVPQAKIEPKSKKSIVRKIINKTITVADLFTGIDNSKENYKLEIQKKYKQLANGKVEIKVLNQSSQIAYTAPASLLMDADFQGQGFKKQTSSLPVRLDRTITADRFIEAVLINSIDSTLAGKIVAQINHNVYGMHGNKILIPIGSRAIGAYQPISKVGTERIGIIWERIITPQGINIVIASATGTDAMGKQGVSGIVDNRTFDRYGVALLTSTLNAMAMMKIPANNQQQQALINTYGKDLSQLGAKILEETMEIKPRILIKAGTIINISISNDIWIHKATTNTSILEQVAHKEKQDETK